MKCTKLTVEIFVKEEIEKPEEFVTNLLQSDPIAAAVFGKKEVVELTVLDKEKMQVDSL